MLVLKVFLISLFFFKCLHHSIAIGPSFTIFAPKIVKHWTNYNVILSLHNSPANTNVTLTISGSNGLSESQKEILPASGAGTLTHTFKMGFDNQWKSGEYKLHVEGVGGTPITYDSTINFVNKHYVILIQSDSPIYRPGDTVTFRVIVLDDYLRPVIDKHIDDMRIYVRDPMGRKLSQFFLKTGEIISSEIYGTNYFNISEGVTNDISFSLSDDVLTGKWIIDVEMTDQKQSYNCFVDRYQTPFATIDIKTLEFKTYTDPIVPVNISCFYTFGKPVKGLATILISKTQECGNKVQNVTYWSNQYNISELLETQIDFRDTRLLNVNCDSNFNLTVIILDSITKQEYFNYKIIEFHQKSIIAKNLNPLQKIKPGLSFRVFIKFLNIEGNEVDVNQLNKLQFEAQIKSDNNQTKNAIPMVVVKKYNNMILDFQTDVSTVELHLVLKLDDKVIDNFIYSSFDKNCMKTMIQIKLQEPLRQLRVDDMVNLIITSNEKMPFLSYYFVAKGEIINASSITFSSSDTSSTAMIPVLLKKEMAPDVTVVVYYYSQNIGGIAFDSLNLEIDGLFQNSVNIKVENTTLNVSQNAKFRIQTQPNSHLLILGIDRAVIRENLNSFITESSVIDQLRNIQETKNVANGEIDKIINFGSSALHCPSFYGIEVVCDKDDKGCNGNNEGIEHFNEVAIRRDYRKTWIWDRTAVSIKGDINLSAKLPDYITSWQLSAISLHNEKGLGITSLPIKITAFRPLFIELKLPYSVVRHEKTEILVIVFNYLPETAKINIKVEQSPNNTIDIKFDSCDGNITSESNQIKIFKCFITAQEIGTAELIARLVANSSSSSIKSDGEIQTVIVKYEGVVINQIKQVYLDFTNEEISNNSIRELLNIEMPSNIIDGSQKVYAMIKFETIDNSWHQLLKQIISNPINFAFPAINANTNCNLKTVSIVQQIYQLHYQKTIDRTDKSAIDGWIANIDNGLNVKCAQFPFDGSIVSRTYSGLNLKAADNSVKSSTWMTALFLKSLQFFKNYREIDRNLIYHTMAWLKRQQVSNGEFLETDPILEMRPNVGHYGLYLTSFVYIALESDINYVEPNIQAVSYVSQLYPTLNKTYDLVIACYVFHLSNHEIRDHCFADIMTKSIIKDDLRYWSGIDGKPDIETTSYGLLILVKRKVYAIAFNTFKYLKSIQTTKGMIGDSIQTSIALESMSALIKSLNNYDQKPKLIDIDINDGNSDHKIVIKPENEVTQILQLSEKSKKIDLSANGYGSAIIQLISQYNIIGTYGDVFNTTVTNSESNDSHINLTVCTRYNLEGSTDNVVIDLDLPTGYKYDANSAKNEIDSLDHIESINDSTHIDVFLKQVHSEEICINVPVIQSFKTISPKPAPIKVYPKNDRSKLTVRELTF